MMESTKTNKISHNSFIRKYFEALQRYASNKKEQKTKNIGALVHFYNRYISNSFIGWKKIYQMYKKLKRASRKINKKT